jgi:hypothetical protein
MSSRRLTDSEKKDVVALYRQSGENATDLADRFGVSNSTIGRILKSAIPEAEFEALLQAKRGARFAEERYVEEPRPIVIPTPPPVVPAPAIVKPRISRIKPAQTVEVAEVVEVVVKETVRTSIAPPSAKPLPKKRIISVRAPEPEVFEDEDDEGDDDDEALLPPSLDVAEFQDVAAELSHGPRPMALADEDDEDDDLDEDFDEDDEDDDEGDDGRDLPEINLGGRNGITIRPFTEASLPKTCYLVVDRSAELVAPPLREFGELGALREKEAQTKTLPVFDNHRVAKRFSNARTHRVIKVPDSALVMKTLNYLVAKGITQVLLDGQVYSLN